MTGSKKDRSSRIRSLFENEIFKRELIKIRAFPDDEWDIHVIQLRHAWTLSWEYHETLTNYLARDEIDYDLGDKDIRVIDYATKQVNGADDPENEFRIMQSLEAVRAKGVYLKLPRELNQIELKNFVNTQYGLIETALNNNYPDRIRNQSPEQQSKRKSKIYLAHEAGVPMKEICALYNCERRTVDAIVKEYKDKIIG